jgi:hypothetical protein
MSVENLNFLQEVVDNALTGVTNPDDLVRALEVIEEMIAEAGESNGEVSVDSSVQPDDESADLANTAAGDIPF